MAGPALWFLRLLGASTIRELGRTRLTTHRSWRVTQLAGRGQRRQTWGSAFIGGGVGCLDFGRSLLSGNFKAEEEGRSRDWKREAGHSLLSYLGLSQGQRQGSGLDSPLSESGRGMSLL